MRESLMGERGGSRFSEEDRRRIVAESYDPGVSVGSVARRHGVSAKQIFTWRRRYRHEKVAGAGTGFVPIEVVGEDVSDVASPRESETIDGRFSSGEPAMGTIGIDLPDGVRVRITGTVALPVLSCVLQQLRGAA